MDNHSHHSRRLQIYLRFEGMKKKLGIVSLSIAIIGFLIIQYYLYHFNLKSEGLGEIVEYYVFGKTNRRLLILSQVIGLVIGLRASRNGSNVVALFGISISIINLIVLFTNGY